YKDYRTWPEDERWELINGTACSMSPAPLREHQGLVGLVYRAFADKLTGQGCKTYMSPIDVFFFSENVNLDDADNVVQPDVIVVCDPAKLIPEGIRGAPDLVVEVISPGTAMRDQTEKRGIYERGGVREYWIANPTTLEVLVYTLKDGRYGLPVPASLLDGVPSEIFPGLVARVRRDEL
ncbi:MAG: Uma2 family endonuclease, partial [Spirochaetaceae bacterium]